MKSIRHIMLVLVLLSATVQTAVVSAGPSGAEDLEPGSALFWKGPYIEDSSTAESGDGCDEPCWTYRVRLGRSGYRLRVGLDHPEVGDAFRLELIPPSGISSSVGTGTGLYSVELLHPRPQTGVWRIRVSAQGVTDSAFRVRAKLEAAKPFIGRGRDPVLPNLQVLPPHEANFLKPITNGSMGDPPQGVDLGGRESCHPEEYEEGAMRCLRFGFGVRNTGRGPMQLYFNGAPPEDHPLFQRVVRADGSSYDRRAGIARWHETHGHYHHNDAIGLRLFRVVDTRTGKLEAVTPKRFKGFAHRNELLRDWDRFYPTLDLYGFGLLAGWSDIYEWDRPGNYIDFGLNPDGHYLVRMWADPVEGILESNELDNVGYSYLKVTGSEVEMIETGRGRSPWDRCKIVVGFGGYPDPKQTARPDNCPPDTT